MKTLQAVVNKIIGHEVTEDFAKDFVNKQFGQVYAWVKADVVEGLLVERKNKRKYFKR
jgi:UDP-galactopyranose mutase